MRIYLGGQYSFYFPGHPAWVETRLDAPAPLRAVLERLGVPPAEVYLVVVNREAVEMEAAIVQDSDEVRLYPPVGGG